MWKKIYSSYKGGCEKPPIGYEVKSGAITISIVNSHIYHKGYWVMHCYQLGIDALSLPKGYDEDTAKAYAIKYVGEKIEALATAIKAIRELP